MATKWAAAVAIALAATGCIEAGPTGQGPDEAEVAANDTAAGVEIRLAGPGEAALLVPVQINGEGPWDFILDTGATLTCVDESLADSLALPEAQGRMGMGGGIQGEAGAIRLVEIDSLSVGNTRAEGMTGCTLDLERFRSMGVEAHGLLGLNFLTSFEVTLDFEGERLRLR